MGTYDSKRLMLTVSHPQFYCLVNRDTRALVACPELLVRKLVESGIEPATLLSTGETLATQPTAYQCVIFIEFQLIVLQLHVF